MRETETIRRNQRIRRASLYGCCILGVGFLLSMVLASIGAGDSIASTTILVSGAVALVPLLYVRCSQLLEVKTDA